MTVTTEVPVSVSSGDVQAELKAAQTAKALAEEGVDRHRAEHRGQNGSKFQNLVEETKRLRKAEAAANPEQDRLIREYAEQQERIRKRQLMNAGGQA